MDVTVKGVVNNTPAEVRVWIDEALAIMGERAIDPLTHDLVLAKLLELLASKTMVTMQQQPVALNPAMFDPRNGPGRGR